MRARLSRVVLAFKSEKPLQWIAEGPNSVGQNSALAVQNSAESNCAEGYVDAQPDESENSSDESEDPDDKYGTSPFVDDAYTVSAVLGSHKLLSELQGLHGIGGA